MSEPIIERSNVGNNGDQDPDAAREFIVQVARHVDGNGTIQIRFDADEEDVDKQKSDGNEPQDSTEVVRRKEPKNPSQSVRLSKLSTNWTSTCIAFFEVVPKLTALNFEYASNDLIERMATYAKSVSSKVKEFDDGETKVTEYFISVEEFPIVATKFGRSTHILQAAEVMGRSSLGALVSEYEAFIARLLEIFSTVIPTAFVTDEDQISIGDLAEFTSIDEAKKALLRKKIEDILHTKSHVEVLTWIGEKFKVNLLSDTELLADFSEICQRRHLLTHAGGVVNRRYLTKCKQAGCDLSKLPGLDEKVSIDAKYLRRATARIFQVGFFTLHILWQKLIPKDFDDSLSCILTTSHDFLENELTKMCRRVCDFALGSTKKKSERTSAYLVINKALSFKHDTELDPADRKKNLDLVLASRDWSILSPTLELALACVREDHSKLEDLATSAANVGVNYMNANTWVVFRGVRDKPEFISKFRRPRNVQIVVP